jgi:hypothetical protein
MTKGIFGVYVSKTDENADYRDLGDALKKGEKNICIDNGVYDIIGKTVNTDGLSITGKSMTGTIINVINTFSVAHGDPGRSTVGTISIEKGTKDVVGIGTKFQSIKANFININGLNHFIFCIKDDEHLTLHFPYYGSTVSNIKYEIAKLLNNVSLKNLTIWSSGGSGGGLLQLIDINNVVVEDIIHFKTSSPIELNEGMRFEGIGNVNINRYIEMGTPGESLSFINCLNVNVGNSLLGNAETAIHVGNLEKENLKMQDVKNKDLEKNRPENTSITIDNCKINSCGTGVRIVDYSGVTITNNIVKNCEKCVELINDIKSNKITINNNRFETSIGTNRNTAIQANNIYDSVINNNIIENMKTGISINNANNSYISNNHLMNVESGVKILQNENGDIENNQV